MRNWRLFLIAFVLAVILAAYGALAPATHIVIKPAFTDEELRAGVDKSPEAAGILRLLGEVEEAKDRVKTSFTNRMTVYKGFLPARRVSFGMPEIFENQERGQVMIGSRVYWIDASFYRLVDTLARGAGVSLDTL